MIIIMGLGNPGKKFNNTPHNAGFAAVDFFVNEHAFPEFEISKKYHALVSEKIMEAEERYHNFRDRDNYGTNVILVKPETFMNESGKTAASLMKNKNEVILMIIRDDIDLPLGKIKISKDSGSGGHKGVQSIIDALGNNQFIQLKIGIQTNDQKAEEVVLKKFTKEEQEIMNKVIKRTVKMLDCFIKNGLEKTMNEFNK